MTHWFTSFQKETIFLQEKDADNAKLSRTGSSGRVDYKQKRPRHSTLLYLASALPRCRRKKAYALKTCPDLLDAVESGRIPLSAFPKRAAAGEGAYPHRCDGPADGARKNIPKQSCPGPLGEGGVGGVSRFQPISLGWVRENRDIGADDSRCPFESGRGLDDTIDASSGAGYTIRALVKFARLFG